MSIKTHTNKHRLQKGMGRLKENLRSCPLAVAPDKTTGHNQESQ